MLCQNYIVNQELLLKKLELNARLNLMPYIGAPEVKEDYLHDQLYRYRLTCID